MYSILLLATHSNFQFLLLMVKLELTIVTPLVHVIGEVTTGSNRNKHPELFPPLQSMLPSPFE